MEATNINQIVIEEHPSKEKGVGSIRGFVFDENGEVVHGVQGTLKQVCECLALSYPELIVRWGDGSELLYDDEKETEG